MYVMKVSELSDESLDKWVAKAEGWELENYAWWKIDRGPKGGTLCYAQHRQSDWKPSTDWLQGGRIIEREKINIIHDYAEWAAEKNAAFYGLDLASAKILLGPTPLIAAMRAYVTKVFGDEVPEDVNG
jgi:hypothetical protein